VSDGFIRRGLSWGQLLKTRARSQPSNLCHSPIFSAAINSFILEVLLSGCHLDISSEG
jgi:hypothetical protein